MSNTDSVKLLILGCPRRGVEGSSLAYSICKRLTAGETLALDSITIKPTLADFPLEYALIDEMIDSVGDGYDAILAVGTWNHNGNPHVLLQRGAGRLDYRRLQPDHAGALPAHEQDGRLGFAGNKDTYETKVDVDVIVTGLQEAGWKNTKVCDTRTVRPEQEKFGKWICEYLYGRLLQKFDAENVTKPVLLVELPDVKEDGGPYDVDETEKIIRQIIAEIASGIVHKRN